MSIVRIEPHQQQKTINTSTASDSVDALEHPHRSYASSDKPSVADISASDGEIDSPENNTDPNHTHSKGKTVVLDGPLSRIYTQALNAVYAAESMAAMNVQDLEGVELNEDDSAMYVYATDGSEMTLEEVPGITKQISEATRDKDYDGKYVVLEGINPYSGMLSECLEGMGVQTISVPTGSSLAMQFKRSRSALESSNVVHATHSTWNRIKALQEA